MSQSPVILLEMNRLVAAISKIDGHAFVGPFQTSAAQQNVRQLREKNQVNARTSLLVLALFSCLSARMTLVGTSLEEKYFEIRDNFIRQFEKASVPIDVLDEKDKHALAELDRQLKPIIGPVNFEGFPKEGKINLLTLQKDYGFGQVDGLRFRAKQEELFVTTDNILKKYLAGQRELPKDLAELSKTGEFYVAPLRRKRLLRTLQRSRLRARTENLMFTRFSV